MKIFVYLKKGDKLARRGGGRGAGIIPYISHQYRFIIISMSTRRWLKIYVVREKGEQGSGEEDWLSASGGVRLVDNSGSTWNLIR